jgi:hypothetical protein
LKLIFVSLRFCLALQSASLGLVRLAGDVHLPAATTTVPFSARRRVRTLRARSPRVDIACQALN